MDEQALAHAYMQADLATAAKVPHAPSAPTPAAGQEDFRNLPRSEQHRRLVALIEQGRSDEEIGNMFRMSQWQVRNLRYRLGIKKDRGGNIYLETPGRSTRGAGQAGIVSARGSVNTPPFAVALHGVYPGTALSQRLEGLRSLLEGAAPERRYEIHLELVEVFTGGTARDDRQ